MARVQVQAWPCDKLSARRSMNFPAAGPTNRSAGGGMFERIYGSRSSLPRKLVWQGHIMHIAAPCLSASPCGQNRCCLRKVFSARILLLMWGGSDKLQRWGYVWKDFWVKELVATKVGVARSHHAYHGTLP